MGWFRSGFEMASQPLQHHTADAAHVLAVYFDRLGIRIDVRRLGKDPQEPLLGGLKLLVVWNQTVALPVANTFPMRRRPHLVRVKRHLVLSAGLPGAKKGKFLLIVSSALTPSSES
jgi:hypothetical protein